MKLIYWGHGQDYYEGQNSSKILWKLTCCRGICYLIYDILRINNLNKILFLYALFTNKSNIIISTS